MHFCDQGVSSTLADLLHHMLNNHLAANQDRLLELGQFNKTLMGGKIRVRDERCMRLIKINRGHLRRTGVGMSQAAMFRAATSHMARIGRSKLLIRLTAILRSCNASLSVRASKRARE